MSPWGYIGVGLALAVAAGVCFALAGPTALDVAMADLSGKTAETNGGVVFVGWLLGMGASVLTLIGVIAEGVRIGNRESE